jgi:hypothetical protein
LSTRFEKALMAFYVTGSLSYSRSHGSPPLNLESVTSLLQRLIHVPAHFRLNLPSRWGKDRRLIRNSSKQLG